MSNASVRIQRICVVGGGHAAHAMVALLAYKGFQVTMFSGFEDEASRLQQAVATQNGIEALFAEHLTPSGRILGKPSLISNSAAQAVKGCDVVLLPLPSFAYENVLREISPHLTDGAFVGVTPGQGGFDWVARKVVGDKVFRRMNWFAILPMPFNCRIVEYGKRVGVQAYKTDYRVACTPVSHIEQASFIVQQLFGSCKPVGHFITATLFPLNPNIHPQRLYGLLHNYKEGDVLTGNPLFYEDMDELSIEMMEKTSAEMQAVSKKLKEAGIEADIPTILEAEQLTWPQGAAKAPNDLKTIFRTSPNYKGFRCPFARCKEREEPEGREVYIPDLRSRYFTEDIPWGLCLYKGVADIVEVSTPTLDKLILWAQTLMHKEYVVNNRLVGKHSAETTAPQTFGICTLAQLKSYYFG